MQLIIALALVFVGSTAHAVDRDDIIKEYLVRSAVIDGTYQPDEAGRVMAQFSGLTQAEQDGILSAFVDTLTAEIDDQQDQIATESARLSDLKAELEAFKAGL